MEKILKEIKSILSLHRESYSFYLCSEAGDGSHWITPLEHPLYFNSDKHYELALVSLETFYSIPNITAENNKLVFSLDGGRSWGTLELPIGSYEIEQINDAIQAKLGKVVEIRPNLATLCSVVIINDRKFQIDMSQSTLRTVLGFNEKDDLGGPNKLEQGTNQSANTVNIIGIANIFVHCDLVSGSYFKGDLSSVVYSFFPSVGVGHKIIQRPSQPLYLPISKRGSINRIRVWITDQNGSLIDFRNEDITVRLHIRSI